MRRREEGRYFVGDKRCPSIGAAVSYAQGLACNWPKGEDRSFYVRDALDTALFRVDLIGGSVYTTAI